MSEHIWGERGIHHAWDLELEPALTIESGDVVHYELLMAGDGQLERGSSFAEARLSFDTLYNLAGPLAVNGAKPGDTLRVDILALQPGDWGWCVILPELGLLPEDFPDGYLRTFDLAGRTTVDFADGIEVPFSPFLGTMGNHPVDPAWALPFPPHRGGGNMDNRHLVAGTTLWLPVHLDGAHCSVGDPHACQGDGEVCVAALECPMSASLRFTLEHRTIAGPAWQSPGALTPATDHRGYHGTSGIDGDLMTAAQGAVRGMIEWLVAEHGLDRQNAYMLCSLAGDLKIHEIVDSGVWNVGLTMPLAVFTGA